MICWKIRIFAYWTTPRQSAAFSRIQLWFAEKFVSLLIEQHRCGDLCRMRYVVICWKIRIFAYWTTPSEEKSTFKCSCDLLKNSYLCLLNNTAQPRSSWHRSVVICWKIRIFAYWTTPLPRPDKKRFMLWFAEKFVSLLIEQHLSVNDWYICASCDLLKNSYLCLLNNT